MLAVSAPYVTQLFKQLERAGLLRRTSEHSIVIIAPQQLWHDQDTEQF